MENQWKNDGKIMKKENIDPNWSIEEFRANYRWIITHDYVADPGARPGTNSNAVGVMGSSGCDLNLRSNPQIFYLYDDDDECYASGILYTTDEAYNGEALFSPLDDYGRPNWGCTQIKVAGEFI